ncbi:MAG: hypothetical protein EBR28_06425 [Planctomycetia bacterium]|nr:hypothetical protein [Planctomycetia bacterium]
MAGRCCRFRCLAVATLLVLAGCSSGVKLCEVKGTVTKAGVGQKNLLVQFSPLAGGRPAIDRTADDGGYILKYTDKRAGALVGPHRVVVFSGGEPVGEGNDTTPLTRLYAGEFEVTPGVNVFDISLP